MPSRKKISSRKLKAVKNFLSFFLKSIVIVLIVAVAADILAYRLVNYYEQLHLTQINQARMSLHGFWVFRIEIQESSLDKYKGVELFDIGTLTVDNDLNVNGIVYRWKEINNEGEVVYPREVRRKSEISGSVIDKSVLLNLVSRNYEGLESIDSLQGTLIAEDAIRGEFFSEVAFQKGIFCGKKVTVGELGNDIYCEF